MQCVTLKKGVECAFMTRKGCNFNGGQCHPVVDQCVGCSKAVSFSENTMCTVSPNPASKWVRGACNFATHLERKAVEQTQKLNPLKASKRAAANR